MFSASSRPVEHRKEMSVLVELDPSKLPSGTRASMSASMNIGSNLSPIPSIDGMRVDSTFSPIPLEGRRQFAAGMGERSAPADSVVVRATISSDEVERMASLAPVIGVWADPQIAPFPVDCSPMTPTGAAGDVARALRADRVWGSTGYRGDGMVIGIVDGGVDGTRFPVVGGWSPDPSRPPGSPDVEWDGHGNMCAFDSMIAAPGAKIHDYAIGRSGGVGALLSSAFQSFHRALLQFRKDGTPHVLSNSWGLYQVAWDPFPPGHPSNYTHNPRHPLTRKMLEVMDAGILVSFAAGNCGSVCADGRCGSDAGPGRSIWGANGHERSITVGAVNLRRDWVGYSSEGPSSLYPEKPDVCGYTHFTGFFPSDTGTSAANPVVAGCLALLRGLHPSLSQDEARDVLRRTASSPTPGGWNSRLGTGVVDVFAAPGALP